MNRVPALPQYNVPSWDIFYPQITTDPEGFVVAATIDGPATIDGKLVGNIQPAISMTGLRQLARKYAGMVDPWDLDASIARIAELEAELASKETELDNAQACLDAIDTFESAGFRARKKAGRPPKPKDTPHGNS